MGLEQVKEEVLREAKSRADAIIKSANAEAARIVKDAESEASRMGKEAAKRFAEQFESLGRKEIASAKLESKKQFLREKNELLSSVFSDAMAALSRLDDRARSRHIKALIAKAKSEIEVARTLCNKHDLKFVEQFRADDSDIAGGIIAENRDGTLRVDYSYETLLEQVRDSHLQGIAKVLFGK